MSVATLYRRFGTKEALIEATLVAVVDELNQRGRRALQVDDPWRALVDFLRAFTEMSERNHGLAEVVSTQHLASLDRARRELRTTIRTLVTRAQRAGKVRADIAWTDVAFVPQAALVGSACLGLSASDRQSARILSVLLDGLRAADHSPLPGRPPTCSAVPRPPKTRIAAPR